MLFHGLQGARILIPTRRDLQPDREFLAERYELFRKGGVSHIRRSGWAGTPPGLSVAFEKGNDFQV
jgi:hypothetical protein